MLRLLSGTKHRLRSLRETQGGSINVLFALSLIPMLGIAGLGVDYGIALSAKAKLDNAADAAALSAVVTAKQYIAANAATQSDPTLTNNAVAAASDRATRAFLVNAGSVPYAAVPAPAVTISRTGQTFSANVKYQTATTNNFGQIFGQKTLQVGGSATAVADIPSYLDFYLLIDVSASMGLPSTLAGQNYLAANNSGCQFACHFPDQSTGYNFALARQIQLRSGAVNTAVCGLLNLAAQPQVPNQYRVGIYPFVTRMATLAGISSNIAALLLTATCNLSIPIVFTTLLDTGTTQLPTYADLSTGTGSGGTHFENSLASIQSVVSPYGDGSSATKSRPFIFLITDGMENTQYFALSKASKYYYPGGTSTYQTPGASWWTGTNPLALDPTLCTALKTAGATISVLYIPYTVLTVTNQNTWETQQANAAVPALPSALQSCATSGFFYTANTPTDINNALAAMFKQAVQVAHLTQ